MKTRLWGAVVVCAVVGCGGGKEGGGTTTGTADTGKPAQTTAAAPPAPPPAAKPAGGDAKPVTPKAMPPFEQLQFTITADKAASGWPKFDAVNAGDKGVMFAAIYGYAYSKDGKLVKRLSTPLSWNNDLAPGAKAPFPVDVGSFEKDKVTADVFELCYDTIKFKGDDKNVEDRTLCTETRPMGGVKGGAGAAGSASADASADAKGGKAKGGGGGKKGKKH